MDWYLRDHLLDSKCFNHHYIVFIEGAMDRLADFNSSDSSWQLNSNFVSI